MITLIVVSHSHKISEGIVDLVTQMVLSTSVTVVAAGGTHDKQIGTDPLLIQSLIEQHQTSERIYLFGDIGSSIMSIEMVLDMIEDTLKEKCFYLDAPIVEGAFVAAVQTLVDPSHEAIVREVGKLKSNHDE